MTFDRADHRALSAEIHQMNVEAGWWTNLETMQPLDRNFGEMLALVHSELSECWEGYASQQFDQHLPTQLNWHIELADACIRVYDLLGGVFKRELLFTPFPLDMPEGFLSFEDRLVYLHALLSNALERFRKGQKADTQMYLWRFLDACFEFASERNFDLLEMIRIKCAYNRDRLDHKLTERQKDGGKKI